MFNDNPVAGTRYIPLRLWDTPQQPRPLPAELPFDVMTPAADAIPRPDTAEQREEDHDNVPDTGRSNHSSVADTSGTSESSPGSSSTTGTNETTDTASSETRGSCSSSDGSTETDSVPSTPPCPRQTIKSCTEEAMSAKVPSRPPSPSLADSSLEVLQILRDQAGHALTRSQYQKQTNAAKQRATVLKRVAQARYQPVAIAKAGRAPTRTIRGIQWCQPLCSKQAERQYSNIHWRRGMTTTQKKEVPRTKKTLKPLNSVLSGGKGEGIHTQTVKSQTRS